MKVDHGVEGTSGAWDIACGLVNDPLIDSILHLSDLY